MMSVARVAEGDNMTDILSLVRGLPATESELRERWAEFGETLSRALGSESWMYPIGAKPSADMISVAKAATDAALARNWRLRIEIYSLTPNWQAVYLLWGTSTRVASCEASTMQLAMSAAALLACAGESNGK